VVVPLVASRHNHGVLAPEVAAAAATSQIMGGEGFETPKAKPTDLQSVLVDHLSIRPSCVSPPCDGSKSLPPIRRGRKRRETSRLRDSPATRAHGGISLWHPGLCLTDRRMRAPPRAIARRCAPLRAARSPIMERSFSRPIQRSLAQIALASRSVADRSERPELAPLHAATARRAPIHHSQFPTGTREFKRCM